ncbi:MAG: heavy-metal-associated domain-containing protein, partial [Demequinaceae bacterium]|nr:heavy-metal-associated domain-containing protein [Demequinaceae bacterium]
MTTTPIGTPDAHAIELPVGGMTCQGCVANITRGLTKLEGVSEATVNLVTKRATILPDGTVDGATLEEAIRSTITGLGYEVLGSPPSGDDASQPSALGRADEHAAHVAADAGRAADYRRRF